MAIRIGMMSFAHMHAYSYAECVRSMQNTILEGIADDNTERGREAAKRFETTYFESYEYLLQQEIDAVIICSENSRHKELTLIAADAGKHVLCEKPIATKMADAREMIEACQSAGVKLMTAFPCRYSPAMIRLKQAVENSAIGNILAIKGTNRGQMPGGWFIELEKSGGGAVIDHTVHVVDLMRWLMKSEVTEVYAEISNLVHGEDYDDVGLLTMTFENGVFATLDTSWSRPKSFPYWGDVTMDITGTNGMIFMDMFAQNIVHYSDETMRTKWEHWGSGIDQGLIEDFTRAIVENRPAPISGEDGLKALEVALAAYESARQGIPIKLPLEE